MDVKKRTLAELPQVRALGRTGAARDPLTLFWTASGVELLFTGSELWLELFADYTAFEPWLSIELDGAWISRFPVRRGQSEMCVFRGMAPGRKKHVRILKDVQAHHDDPSHLLQISGLHYEGGSFLSLPDPSYRLEFIGDSLTSGEGAIGAIGEEDWVGAFFSAENHYARMTADALGAEYRILSQSGWGLVCGWDNDPRHVMPPFYEEVCGVADGARNLALGAHTPYDFSGWPADAVIVNLGTNDVCALRSPAWRETKNGQTFQMQPASDGGFSAQDARRLEQAAYSFFCLLRQKNPNACLLWVYGAFGSEFGPIVEAALRDYRLRSQDARAFSFALPAVTSQTMGAREHPGRAWHAAAAQALLSFLQPLL